MLLQSFSGDFNVVSSLLWLECDVKADVAVTALGFTRAQLDNCTNFSFSPKFDL